MAKKPEPRPVASKIPESEDPNQLMLEDLARSGLTPSDAKLMGLLPRSPGETESMLGRAVPSYIIPYFSPDKRPLPYAMHAHRWRLLREVRTQGERRAPKYLQEKDSLPHFYFPPTYTNDWSPILQDASKPLWITEGEKKAAIASRLGIPTIALGGVFSFSAKKYGQALIPDFKLVEWTQRQVILAFDSDIASNPQVLQAIDTLSSKLSTLGAYTKLARIPALDPNAKTGLDDYLVHHKLDPSSLEDLDFEECGFAKELLQLNKEFAFVGDTGFVYDTKRS